MKKVIYGLASVALAVGAVAATKAKVATKFSANYFFAYTTNGAAISTIYPTHQGTGGNPPTTAQQVCLGSHINCEEGVTGFVSHKYMVGTATWYYFTPTGQVPVLNKKD